MDALENLAHYCEMMHLPLTLMMFVVFVIMQWLHYPLFAGLGEADFSQWHAFHSERISYVVIPLMTLELFCSLVLAFHHFSTLKALAVLFTIGIWLVTFLGAVPLHGILSQGKNLVAIQKLLQVNGWRVVLNVVKISLLLFPKFKAS